MGEFVVYRNGRNPSNQPNSDQIPVSAVEAVSATHAIELVAGASYITIMDGQYLTASPLSESTIDDWEIAAAMEVLDNIILQHY